MEFPGFRVLGANNPALFFAFYCHGVFSIWNENWDYEFAGHAATGKEPSITRQVLEIIVLVYTPKPKPQTV